MAAVTKYLSFGITASTTYENPFLLARRFATLDHLTKGRVAWNVVTSHLESAARNVGLETQIAHDERYQMADEYMSLTYKLWEGSWRDGAVMRNSTQYTTPGSVRRVDHQGYVEYMLEGRESKLIRAKKILQVSGTTNNRAINTEDTLHIPSWNEHCRQSLCH